LGNVHERERRGGASQQRTRLLTLPGRRFSVGNANLVFAPTNIYDRGVWDEEGGENTCNAVMYNAFVYPDFLLRTIPPRLYPPPDILVNE
jgi:hypothetical protein